MIRRNRLNVAVVVIFVTLTSLAIGLSNHHAVLEPTPRSNGNDYPAKLANAPTDSFADPWGAGNRECTSYVAWKVYETWHDMPYWTGAQSNALNWGKLAKAAGFLVDTTPTIGSVAVFQPGWTAQIVGATTTTTFTQNTATGHVAWVEAIDNDTITVSEYNGTNGTFDTRVYPRTGLQFIHFNQRAN
jgi:surface antigen